MPHASVAEQAERRGFFTGGQRGHGRRAAAGRL